MANQKKPPGADQKTAPSFLEIHQQASRKQQDSYIDLETGYHVLTAYFLKERGYCCTNKCRHCPYGFHEQAWPDAEIQNEAIGKNEVENRSSDKKADQKK